MKRIHMIALVVLVPAALLVAACTTRVVGYRGIYSTEQLPKETQTPLLDGIDEIMEQKPRR